MKKPVTINALQAHVKAVDYKPDQHHEVVLKLFEEVGELSVEMRKVHQLGLTEQNKQNVKYELYDVIHYVVHIANLYGIDLEEAILAKDAINQVRYKEQRGESND